MEHDPTLGLDDWASSSSASGIPLVGEAKELNETL
jgi:hypothetical protein